MPDGNHRDFRRAPEPAPAAAPAPSAAAPEPSWLPTDLFDLRRLWAIFLRRAILFFPIAGVVAIWSVLTALQATPTFRTTSSVLIESLQRGSLDQNGTTGYLPPTDTNSIDTQVQLITSQAVTARVIRQLGLQNEPEFAVAPVRRTRPGGLRRVLLNPLGALTNRGREKAYEPPPMAPAEGGIPQQLINNVSSQVQARRSGLTYVINITAISIDAEMAARLANAYAAAYIQQGLDAKLTNSRNASGALGEQLTTLQRDVVTADTAVQAYKIAHNLMSASGGTMAEQEVSALNSQIAAAEAERAGKEAKLQSARAQIAKGGGGEDVGAALGSDTVSRLRAQESESIRELTELNLRYGDKYPAVQKAKNQLKETRDQIAQEITRILSNLDAEAQAARQRVASLKASQAGARNSLISNNSAQTGLLELQRKADASRSVYEAFLNRSKETSAQATVQQPDARIVAVAQPPNWPSSPDVKVAMVVGMGLGVFAGLLVVVIAEMLDNGVQTGTEVERRFGLHYAGSVPTLKTTWGPKSKKSPPADFLIDNPFSTFAESLRSLRAFLILPGAAEPPKLIAITSALPGEGKSLTSYCMARTLAVAGARVALVDCDLRRRGVSSNVKPGEGGIIEVLTGKVALDDALVKDERSETWVLPALSAPRDAVDLFATPAMSRLLDDLRARFDYVLLDTAPVLAVADTRLLAARADTVLMLVQWRRTPFKAADTAVDLLLESGSNIAGVALTRVNLRQQSRYGYGDRNYYYKALRSYYAD